MKLLKKLFPKHWNMSIEDPNKEYFTMFSRRYIFCDGKYMGWYKV